MKNVRIALWGLVAVVAVLLGWQAVMAFGDRESRVKAVASIANYGGPFTATVASAAEPEGKPITQQDMLGRPHAIFFGFTHCPEICPTTLYETGQWLNAMGSDADKLDVYFVTVDPERDSAAYMADYLRAFDPRIKAITGTPEQIADIVKAWRVVAEKVPGTGDDYNMNHTTSVFLMEADGSLKNIINYGEPVEDAVAKLTRLVDV